MESDRDGRPRRVMVATRPSTCAREPWRPRDPAILRGEDPLPDVILEVDHTTDVRRNKLGLYEAWGLPGGVGRDARTSRRRSRPVGLRPGLTIRPPERGPLPRGERERHVPHLDGGRDPRRAERADARPADPHRSWTRSWAELLGRRKARPPTTTRNSAGTVAWPTARASAGGPRGRTWQRAWPDSGLSSAAWRRASSTRATAARVARALARDRRRRAPRGTPATGSSIPTTDAICLPGSRDAGAAETSLRLPSRRAAQGAAKRVDQAGRSAARGPPRISVGRGARV